MLVEPGVAKILAEGGYTKRSLRLDLILLGEDHLYHGEGIAFDPEGLLSTLPSIVNVTMEAKKAS